MTDLDFNKQIVPVLRQRGLEARMVPVERLTDLATWFDELVAKGQLSQPVMDTIRFDFTVDRSALPVLPGGRPVRSLVVAAQPSSYSRVLFRLNGEPRELVMPPVFAGYDDVWAAMGRVLEQAAEPAQYRFFRADLPAKSLAAFTGMARYGRNNIAYVPGWGSYIFLAGFVTDMPSDDVGWIEPATLDRCSTCIACARACSTGAIDGDRFLLHTDRCLPFLNDYPGDFPSWVDPSWHEFPVGCLACQRACPENAGLKQWGPTEEFSEDETRLLLAGAREEELSDDLVGRLRRAGILPRLHLMPRNLGVLL